MVLRTGIVLVLLASVTAGAHAEPAWVFLEDDIAPPLAIGGSLAVSDPPNLDVRLLVCGDSREELTSYYLLKLSGSRCSISRVADGETVLLREAPMPTVTAGTVAFAVHRDGWRLALLLNGVTVVKAWDAALTGAVFGSMAVSGGTVSDAYGQEIGEVMAADTFEREEGAKDDWTALSGTWEHVSLREDRQAGQMQADKTTNAFSYSGRGKGGPGLTTLGNWWWRNCSYSVSVRCRGTDSVAGLAFHVQDARNYMLLRAANRMGAAGPDAGLALIAVCDGNATILAQRPGGILPDQWYRLRAVACDDRARCYLDDELLFDEPNVRFGQGPVGMYVEGADGASFDDVLVSEWDDFRESFGPEALARWESTGEWGVSEGAVHHAGPDSGVLATGDPLWSSMVVSATAAGRRAAPGLVAGYQSPDDYYVFRWANSAGPSGVADRAQLVHVTADGEEMLGDEPLPADPPETLVARLEVRAGLLAGYLGERRVVVAPLAAAPEGRVGLCGLGDGTVSFPAFNVEPLAERRAARVVKEFTDTKEHFEMVEWASTRHAWVLPTDKDPATQVWWTKGDYYGPLEVRVPITKIGSVAGKATLDLLGDKAGQPLCRVVIAAAKGSTSLSVTVTAGEAEVGTASADAAGEEAELTISVTGRVVEVTLGEEPMLQVTVPAVPATAPQAAAAGG